MSIILVTGSAGLIGSESVRFFCDRGFTVVGIDNNLRQVFFGPDASTEWNRNLLLETYGDRYLHHTMDIRDQEAIFQLFQTYGTDISLIIHTAAQPSHDWAAKDPYMDFTVNANGTLVLLENTRQHCPGYKGKQVRDNIHSYDLVNAFYHFYQSPRVAEIYNIGGSRFSNCSMLEAIQYCEEITNNKLD